MISKAFQILCLAGIALISSALQSCEDCSEKVPCPAYQDELFEQWLPYYDGTVISFKSPGELPAVYTFVILDSTKPYETRSSSPQCVAQKILVTKERLNSGDPTFRINMVKAERLDGGEISRSISMMLQGYKIYGRDVSDAGFMNISSAASAGSSENFPSVVLDGKTFANVQCTSFDTSNVKVSAIYKLYFSKGQGLVGYETFNPKRLWVKD